MLSDCGGELVEDAGDMSTALTVVLVLINLSLARSSWADSVNVIGKLAYSVAN